MAFLNGFGKKVSDASQSAIQKTKELADIAKQSAAITEEEKKIAAAYQKIGKMYVEQFGETAEGEIADIIAQVKASDEKIADCKKKIRDLKGITLCTSCGAEVPLGSQFCSGCGAKIETETAPVVEEVVDEVLATEAPAEEAPAEEVPAADVTPSEETSNE